MKTMVCLLLCFLTTIGFAAEIIWDLAPFDYEGKVWGGTDDQYALRMPFLVLYASALDTGIKLSVETLSYMEFRSSVKVVSEGDEVGPETMTKGPYFYHADFDTTGINNAYSDYDIYMNYYDKIFLATEEESFYSPGKVYYGWVELELGGDGILRLVRSAYDCDGESIIVDPIPEPSCVLLLLLGLGVLGLCRKRMGA